MVKSLAKDFDCNILLGIDNNIFGFHSLEKIGIQNAKKLKNETSRKKSI